MTEEFRTERLPARPLPHSVTSSDETAGDSGGYRFNFYPGRRLEKKGKSAKGNSDADEPVKIELSQAAREEIERNAADHESDDDKVEERDATLGKERPKPDQSPPAPPKHLDIKA